MKNFFKKFLVFAGILVAVTSTINLVNSAPTFADTGIGGRACPNFLGMTSWDCGFVETINSETVLTDNIVKIATNILTDITVIAAYLVLGYVIWGGYLYMFSSGDAGKAAAGKKTLQHAFIGLAIVVSAYTIFGAIRIALLGGGSFGDCDITSGRTCTDGGTLVTNLIQWVAGMGGVVAAIFVVIGGWGYITAAGDPGKLQKAKTTIMYALIGLVIVALAEVLTAFVSSLVRGANGDTSYLDQSSIALNIKKENL